MKVGDEVVILPTRKRRRKATVVGLSPVCGGAFAEIVTRRKNGTRKWVPLFSLQLPDALPAVK